ncbi:hypothetical protein [Actinomarinicola tropica]|uniref:Uncharacterized protein n=1 Tax=Actinomarinicola tropica TaxID=2789776 RepID=A0A5Q2RDD7_9ACTN|nr:hypothetical protein [Actinomarinicola tropica]QGG94878.1 hypothetical protein GH723_07020 [Actinomarinicola tropica]
MERSADVTIARPTARPGGFYQVLDVADVDVDLRVLIDRWSGEGEVAVLQRERTARAS